MSQNLKEILSVIKSNVKQHSASTKDEISINSGMGEILPKGDFALLNSSEIEQMMKEENEKNQKIIKEQEIKKQKERLEKQNTERQDSTKKIEESNKNYLYF